MSARGSSSSRRGRSSADAVRGEGEASPTAEALVLGEGEAGVVVEAGLLEQRQRLVVQAAQVVVAHSGDRSAGARRQIEAVGAQRAAAEPVGVAAVQPDLAPRAPEQVEHGRDAPRVGLGLVAVHARRVTRDDEERRVDAASVLALDHLKEGPVRVCAARKVTREPVADVSRHACGSLGIAVAEGARRGARRTLQAGRCPAPEVVDVVGQRDGEAGAGSAAGPHPAGRRQRLKPAFGEPRGQGAAQKLDVGVHGRPFDAQRWVGGEGAGQVGQAAEAVALARGVLVPAGEQGEGRGDEVERDGEAGSWRRKRAEGRAGGALVRRERAGRQRSPLAGKEVHRIGAARDRRHAGDGSGGVGEGGVACLLRVAREHDAAAQRRQHRAERPLRPRGERAGDVDEDGQASAAHRRVTASRPRAGARCGSPSASAGGRSAAPPAAGL